MLIYFYYYWADYIFWILNIILLEATIEPDYFGFYSEDLKGFTGIGHSIEDCVYRAKWGMKEHLALLIENNIPIPPKNPNPKIIIQNEFKTQAA